MFLGGFLFGMVLDCILEGVILELAIWYSGMTIAKLITSPQLYARSGDVQTGSDEPSHPQYQQCDTR